MPETPERPKDKKCPSESCGRSYHHTMQLTYCPICGAKLVEAA